MLSRSAFVFSAISVVALTQIADAADLPRKAPAPAPVVAVASWTGCYAGGVGGFQNARSSQDYGGLVNGVPNAFLPAGFEMAPDYTVNGATFGGTLGCNYQVPGTRWVLGFEGDFSSLRALGVGRPGDAAIQMGLNQNFRFSTEQHWMATARGRVGYAWDRVMIYATGGAIWGGFDGNNFNGTGVITAQRVAYETTATGWTAGVGVEYVFLPQWSNWTFKFEGLYADYGTFHYGDEPGIANGCTAGCANADVKTTAWMARVGLNYRFWTW